MDALEQLQRDVQAGHLGLDRLVDLIGVQQRQLQTTQQQLQTTQQQLQAALQRIAALEHQLGGPPTVKLEESFSVRVEEQRQAARGQKKPKRQRRGRRGRLRTQDKIDQAERTEPVYPRDVPPDRCVLSHTRPVWRLEANRAVLVAYQIYRGPNNQYGQIPGVLGRSEFGIEIVTEIAYLVYHTGLSFDKVCELLQFFQNLKLRKSQVDRLLHQLARHWEQEFETLCLLVANAAVVHADETSWSIHSVWALLSEQARVVLFGVHKDAETLQQVLDPATFAGILVSDDAAVYANFSAAQKCWAHLLRKGIKLTLQDPQEAEYRAFTDGLLAIYRDACRVQRDRRFGEAGRQQQVQRLEAAVEELCLPRWQPDSPPLEEGLANDYRLLVNEVMRLTMYRELFTFVTAAAVEQPNGTVQPVSGTNNEAERTLRGAAQARKTGRTNKTGPGARRQTILTSVLESLRLYLPTFTLTSVVAELLSWWAAGQSCFARRLAECEESNQPSESPVLERLFPSANLSPVPTPSG
jgi:transposase